MIEGGAVWRCFLQKLLISESSQKYTKYTKYFDSLPVVLRFGNLSGTLIPFDEPVEMQRQLGGTIFYLPIQDEINLVDLDCYLET